MPRKVVVFSCLVIILLFVLGSFDSGQADSDKKDNAFFEKLSQTAYNFRQVNTNLYRSGLISKESIPYLKELGIKTVVTFDNRLARVEEEQKFLEQTGIRFISIPWSGWDKPDDRTIRRIQDLMNDPANQPVLVHCKHGQERTGVVVATWRIAHEGWNFERAFNEMKACGFRSFQYGHLKNYVSEFSEKQSGQKAALSSWERWKTEVLSFFYRLRKLKFAST